MLQQIQRLQYTDLNAAHDMLRTFIEDVFSVEVAEVALRPLAVSLNSFNGFVTLADGKRLFFKSHVEPGGVIAEYYNSDLMRDAGYPVIMPVMASTTPGKQLLLYEVVEDRSVFDAAWAIERGEEPNLLPTLTAAQEAADRALWDIYQQTLAWQDADAHAQAPIHQLFHHRLAQGRLDDFYGAGVSRAFPTLGNIPLGRLRKMQWVINGRRYEDSLDDVITRALAVLGPGQGGPAVVGHGDAHNGNVFLRGEETDSPHLVYFDPAFAGRHDPLLDLVKPFYHNVFAMWMYFPAVFAAETPPSVAVSGDTIHIASPQRLHPVREMFWRSKTEHVLKPLVKTLAAKQWLRDNWRARFQSALACCPLLTMNLADETRFPPPVAMLGFAHTIEMGSTSRTNGGSGSRVEMWLNDVETAL